MRHQREPEIGKRGRGERMVDEVKRENFFFFFFAATVAAIAAAAF